MDLVGATTLPSASLAVNRVLTLLEIAMNEPRTSDKHVDTDASGKRPIAEALSSSKEWDPATSIFLVYGVEQAPGDEHESELKTIAVLGYN